MPDDLLTPTITQTPASVKPPWRVDSLLYPAFFGGPLAAALLGAINAGRLGVTGRKLALIVTAGVAAFAAVMIAVPILQAERTGLQRITVAAGGLVVWGVTQAMLRRPFRAFSLRGGEPASLWGPGIAATIGLGFAQYVLLALVVAVAR